MGVPMELEEGDPEAQEGTGRYMKGVRNLYEGGVTKVPTKYILPIQERPNITGAHRTACDDGSGSGSSARGAGGRGMANLTIKLPIIDLQLLRHPNSRPLLLQSISRACEDYGFFQVVNHGIPREVLRGILDSGRSFFEQPFEERSRFMSCDVRAPVRYGTSFNQMSDRVLYWRDFLKLSCHALPSALPYWPSSPQCFRESTLAYEKHSKRLCRELVAAVVESMGLKDRSIHGEFEEGTHLLVVNYFPPCPEPDLTLGMPPHSDYGFLTLVLQDTVRGLQIQCKGEWVTIEPMPNSIIVHVGDHLEIFSNGRYKSALHRVLVNSNTIRMSVASLHSLPFDYVVRPAPELIDDNHPRRYMDTNFSSFLNYLSSSARHEVKHKSFLQTRMLPLEVDHNKSSQQC